jgi:hypothetical protein
LVHVARDSSYWKSRSHGKGLVATVLQKSSNVISLQCTKEEVKQEIFNNQDPETTENI